MYSELRTREYTLNKLNGKNKNSQENNSFNEHNFLRPEPLQCKGLENLFKDDPNKINWAEASGYYKKRKNSEPLQCKGLDPDSLNPPNVTVADRDINNVHNINDISYTGLREMIYALEGLDGDTNADLPPEEQRVVWNEDCGQAIIRMTNRETGELTENQYFNIDDRSEEEGFLVIDNRIVINNDRLAELASVAGLEGFLDIAHDENGNQIINLRDRTDSEPIPEGQEREEYEREEEELKDLEEEVYNPQTPDPISTQPPGIPVVEDMVEWWNDAGEFFGDGPVRLRYRDGEYVDARHEWLNYGLSGGAAGAANVLRGVTTEDILREQVRPSRAYGLYYNLRSRINSASSGNIDSSTGFESPVGNVFRELDELHNTRMGEVNVENAERLNNLNTRHTERISSIEADNATRLNNLETRNARRLSAFEEISARRLSAVDPQDTTMLLQVRSDINARRIEIQSENATGRINLVHDNDTRLRQAQLDYTNRLHDVEVHNANRVRQVQMENADNLNRVNVESTNRLNQIQAESAARPPAVDTPGGRATSALSNTPDVAPNNAGRYLRAGGNVLNAVGTGLSVASTVADGLEIANSFGQDFNGRYGISADTVETTAGIIGASAGGKWGGVAAGMATAAAKAKWGAKIGATIGSIIPGKGTIIGGVLGAVVGGAAGLIGSAAGAAIGRWGGRRAANAAMGGDERINARETGWFRRRGSNNQ